MNARTAPIEKTDTALNESYREIAARLADDAAAMPRLQTAQRAWIAFRDVECEFATADSADGSIYPYFRSAASTVSPKLA